VASILGDCAQIAVTNWQICSPQPVQVGLLALVRRDEASLDAFQTRVAGCCGDDNDGEVARKLAITIRVDDTWATRADNT
jgi:hypothetical protein